MLVFAVLAVVGVLATIGFGTVARSMSADDIRAIDEYQTEADWNAAAKLFRETINRNVARM